jgi:hypothetical protein
MARKFKDKWINNKFQWHRSVKPLKRTSHLYYTSPKPPVKNIWKDPLRNIENVSKTFKTWNRNLNQTCSKKKKLRQKHMKRKVTRIENV